MRCWAGGVGLKKTLLHRGIADSEALWRRMHHGGSSYMPGMLCCYGIGMKRKADVEDCSRRAGANSCSSKARRVGVSGSGVALSGVVARTRVQVHLLLLRLRCARKAIVFIFYSGSPVLVLGNWSRV